MNLEKDFGVDEGFSALSISRLHERCLLYAKKVVIGRVVSGDGVVFSVCRGFVDDDFKPEKLVWV